MVFLCEVIHRCNVNVMLRQRWDSVYTSQLHIYWAYLMVECKKVCFNCKWLLSTNNSSKFLMILNFILVLFWIDNLATYVIFNKLSFCFRDKSMLFEAPFLVPLLRRAQFIPRLQTLGLSTLHNPVTGMIILLYPPQCPAILLNPAQRLHTRLRPVQGLFILRLMLRTWECTQGWLTTWAWNSPKVLSERTCQNICPWRCVHK